MIGAVELPAALERHLRAEALSAYPCECCGLIEGFTDGNLVRVVALHPTPNLAQEPDQFEIDPAAHIALLRTFRSTGREIIGCYHSHPNGRAELSEHDRASAVARDFLWLICAIETNTQATIAVFVSGVHSFLPVPIMTPPGTASVPPA